MKTFAAFAFLLTVAAVGCTGTSPYMTPGDRGGITAAAETATVVFVRPSSGGADRVTILDGKGRFLGDTLPRTHFAVTMPAGEHTFISWGENTSAIKATLAGGKVYYVEAYGPTGPGTPRLELRAVTLHSSSYGRDRRVALEDAAARAERDRRPGLPSERKQRRGVGHRPRGERARGLQAGAP